MGAEKSQFVSERMDSQKPKCGCYIINEEIVQKKPGYHFLAPLNMSEYHLEIANAITNVNLTQSYFNPT